MPEYFPSSHRPGLFRSCAWLYAWKTVWGESEGIEPCVQHKLAESVYRYAHRVKKIIPVITAFPLGVSTSAAPSIRSEYFILPEDAGDLLTVAKAYLNTIADAKWHQFYIPDLLAGSADFSALKEAAFIKGWDFVVLENRNTYGVDVSDNNFAAYLAALGSNTRLKLFNRRKNLEALGVLEIKNIWPDKDAFLTIINSFHNRRWGKPCYQGKNANFMVLLLDELAKQGYSIDLSVMTLNSKPISVMLDIAINGRVYNLQSGYEENFAKGISLGTLHFGYQIEAAFKSAKIDFYDFMAGNGKNTNYKSNLANRTAQFNTVLLVRNPILKMLYKIHQRLLEK